MHMPHHNIARPNGTHSRPRATSDSAGNAMQLNPAAGDVKALVAADRWVRMAGRRSCLH